MISSQECWTDLTHPYWQPDHDIEACINLSVPGITTKDQPPAALKSLTMEMIEKEYPTSTWTHVYTDGSAEGATINGGSGVHIRHVDGERTDKAVAGGQTCTNYRAEVLAIQTAADLLISSEKPHGNVVIFTDSMSALQALDSPDPEPMIQTLKTSLTNLNRIAQTTLQWVPAHVGLAGNEHADRLAKEGSKLCQPFIAATYEDAKTLLRNEYRNSWQQRNSGYSARQDPIRTLNRPQQTIIYRLRTGHCRLRAHLKRIGVSTDALCQCGQAEQTPSHVLQECPLLIEKRQHFWPQGVDLATKLWGTADDLARTASYVASLDLSV